MQHQSLSLIIIITIIIIIIIIILCFTESRRCEESSKKSSRTSTADSRCAQESSLPVVCVPYLSNDSERSCLWRREHNFLPCLAYHRLCFHTADHNLVNDNLVIRKHFFKGTKCSLPQQNSWSKCNSAAGSIQQEQVLQSAGFSQPLSTLYKHTSIFAFGKHNKIFLSHFTADFSNA